MRTPHRKPYRRRRAVLWDSLVPAVLMFAAIAALMLGGVLRPPSSALARPAERVALVDQHFAGCDAARAAGRESIPSWDPSYRDWMDGDSDGLACEPRRY